MCCDGSGLVTYFIIWHEGMRWQWLFMIQKLFGLVNIMGFLPIKQNDIHIKLIVFQFQNE